MKKTIDMINLFYIVFSVWDLFSKTELYPAGYQSLSWEISYKKLS